ncbi:MAG: MFS transporter [Caldilineaceae bacterium]
MRLGLAVAAVGALIVGVSSGIGLAAVGMILWGIGIVGFVPNLQAYISARLPYAQRARGIGILEYSWALAGIVGLFIMGLLIAQFSWRTPFFVLGLGMLIMALVLGVLPRARTAQERASSLHALAGQPEVNSLNWSARVRRFFDLGPNARSAYATMAAAAALFIAAMQVMITHGAWLRLEYALGPAQLGVIALIMGLADLCGSGSVSLLTDKIGKRRSVLLGVIGAAIGFLIMPLLNVSVVMAVLGIVLARAFFEFAIVSNIPLLSEQAPLQRGKVMTLGAAFNLCGATLAGISGPWLYTTFGVWGLGLVSAALSLLSSLIIWRWVQDAA